MHRPYTPYHHTGLTFVRVVFIMAIFVMVMIAVYASLLIPDKSKVIPPPKQYQTISSPTPATDSGTKLDTPAKVSGPGGCSSVEACLQYCDTHPSECSSQK